MGDDFRLSIFSKHMQIDLSMIKNGVRDNFKICNLDAVNKLSCYHEKHSQQNQNQFESKLTIK